MTMRFSYHYPTSSPRVVRRPWWNLFGRDRIETQQTMGGFATELTRDEAQLLIEACRREWSDPLGRLVQKLLPRGASFIQLEEGERATPYIKTSSE